MLNAVICLDVIMMGECYSKVIGVNSYLLKQCLSIDHFHTISIMKREGSLLLTMKIKTKTWEFENFTHIIIGCLLVYMGINCNILEGAEI